MAEQTEYLTRATFHFNDGSTVDGLIIGAEEDEDGYEGWLIHFQYLRKWSEIFIPIHAVKYVVTHENDYESPTVDIDDVQLKRE